MHPRLPAILDVRTRRLILHWEQQTPRSLDLGFCGTRVLALSCCGWGLWVAWGPVLVGEIFPGAKTKPQLVELGFCGIKTLAMTYSCMRMHTTIGAAAFHFRVRDGIGWCHSAMFTRERVEGRGSLASGLSP